MARHRGHHRNRLLRIFLRTSAGERPHSGHGTATSSGLSMTAFLWLPKERPARPAEDNRAGRVPHTYGGVERDAPASIGPPAPRLDRRSTCYASVLAVQRLARVGNVERERSRNGEFKSAEGRTTKRPGRGVRERAVGAARRGAAATLQTRQHEFGAAHQRYPESPKDLTEEHVHSKGRPEERPLC